MSKTGTTLVKKSETGIDLSSIKAKDLKKLPKAELVRMMEAALLPLQDPEKYKELVKASMPEFVQEVENKEDAGTAMYEAGQEMMLVVFDCLRRYHDWDDEKLKKLNRELTDVLTGVKEFEDNGLSMLSIHSVGIVGDNVEELGIAGLLKKIAEVRLQKSQMAKSGIEMPKISEKPFLKK